MLKPASDRLDYGNLLTPPLGYQVLSAVGTTYSLDLDALVGACIALGLSENTDSLLRQSPIYLLEALRQTADKVVLFCEAGQIAMPANQNSLYILLERMVYQVNLKKNKKLGGYPSFHPKFWLIKYSNNQGDLKYRVIVLSRNLTFDRSWDISVALDGSVGGELKDRSQPISDFLKYLAGYIRGTNEHAKTKRKLINSLAREVNDVSFTLNNKIFNDFEFIPVGIKNQDGDLYNVTDSRLFTDTFHEVMIVSPFLSDSIIQDFNTRNNNITDPDCTLITRKASLEKLKVEHCDKFKIYTMKDTIVDGETALSDEDDKKKKQDIHAKMFLHRKYSGSELYLGSLNATRSAVSGNIEFMLRLLGPNRYLNATILKNDLFGVPEDNKDNPFEETTIPISSSGEGIDENDVLQKKIKELCHTNPLARVIKDDVTYSINIEFEELQPCEGLSISPLLSNKSAVVAPAIKIEGLDILQLSEFYHVTAEGENTSVHRVIKIDTADIPDREQAVVSGIIKDKHCFVKYLAFLLSDDYLLSILENHRLKHSGLFAQNGGVIMPALYERMLRTAAHSPERFKEIEYIMQMLTDKSVIPDKFPELYNYFKKAVGLE